MGQDECAGTLLVSPDTRDIGYLQRETNERSVALARSFPAPGTAPGRIGLDLDSDVDSCYLKR